MLIVILTETEYTSNCFNRKLCSPPFIEGCSLPLAAGKLKLGLFAEHQFSVFILELLKIPISHDPKHAHQSLSHWIAVLFPWVIRYFLPSFTLNRNEWGQGLRSHEDSHSAVVKLPKMKSLVVLTIVRVQPFLSQHLWKSVSFHPSVVAS